MVPSEGTRRAWGRRAGATGVARGACGWRRTRRWWWAWCGRECLSRPTVVVAKQSRSVRSRHGGGAHNRHRCADDPHRLGAPAARPDLTDWRRQWSSGFIRRTERLTAARAMVDTGTVVAHAGIALPVPQILAAAQPLPLMNAACAQRGGDRLAATCHAVYRELGGVPTPPNLRPVSRAGAARSRVCRSARASVELVPWYIRPRFRRGCTREPAQHLVAHVSERRAPDLVQRCLR